MSDLLDSVTGDAGAAPRFLATLTGPGLVAAIMGSSDRDLERIARDDQARQSMTELSRCAEGLGSRSRM